MNVLFGRRNVKPSVDLIEGAAYTDEERERNAQFMPPEGDVLLDAILNQTGLKVELLDASEASERQKFSL